MESTPAHQLVKIITYKKVHSSFVLVLGQCIALCTIISLVLLSRFFIFESFLFR